MARRVFKSARLVLVFVAALAAGVGALIFVSYRNTITPAGIILHHSAIPAEHAGGPVDVRLIDKFHERRGFGIFYWGRTYHVGYHYLILPDGTVQQGRPERCQGAHAQGHNDFIGICLVGNYSEKENPNGARDLPRPTDAQLESLVRLCRQLSGRYRFTSEKILRHADVAPHTECPGDRFPFQDVINRVN